MKRMLRVSALACLVLGATAAGARADVMYTLTDVKLVDAWNKNVGTLTGSFTLDALNKVVTASITASSGTTTNGFTFSNFTYAMGGGVGTAVSAYTAHLPGYIQFYLGPESSPTQQLRLVFDGALKSSGTTNFNRSASHENQPGAGNRTIGSGSIVASPVVAPVPEASTLALAAAFAPAFLYASRRMNRRRAA